METSPTDGVNVPDGAAGPLMVVDDLEDPCLLEYRGLNDPAARRLLEAELSIIVVEGRVAVRQLLDSVHPVRSLLVDDHQVTLAADLVAAVRARGATVYVAPRDQMADLVGFRLHRGVVAIAERPRHAEPDEVLAEAALRVGSRGQPTLVAILEGLNDPENVGALFRNAAAFGVAGVLLDPTCADPLYRRAIRVSVGHTLHVPFARLEPWPAGLGRVRAAGFAVCALVPHPGGPAGEVTFEDLEARSSDSAPKGWP